MESDDLLDKATDFSAQENSVCIPHGVQEKNEGSLSHDMESVKLNEETIYHQMKDEILKQQISNVSEQDDENHVRHLEVGENHDEEKQVDPVFDGTEVPELEACRSLSASHLDHNQDAHAYAWPEKAVALKNFVKEKGTVAVSTLLRRLSGRKDEDEQVLSDGDEKNVGSEKNLSEDKDSSEKKPKDAYKKIGEMSAWNPLNLIKINRDAAMRDESDYKSHVYVEHPKEEGMSKGRIIVYTRLGCQESRQVRLFMSQKGLRYIEINVDIYPSRKLELEKNTGSPSVPRIYFNDLLIGGLTELRASDESGELQEKLNYLFNEDPSPAAPLPPLPGEDDSSGSGTVDELAAIVRKMKDSIIVKDRFHKMRRFNNSFLGSEAVEFLSEDQYLEKEEAVEFGRKLADQHFFQHVLGENVFEYGNRLYRFLEDDPVISKCHNINYDVLGMKPKPVSEIASRLRLVSYAIFEAYVSEDGRHVDYGSIHSSEEFRRYLRIIQELQRVELEDISREEKLAFFINLYNMMAIHAILIWGYPDGPLERRKFLGEFKYVVGGYPYSLSAIQNGVLRGNQRPPYNLVKPFGSKDRRSKVALPYPEPLVHFALVCGTRSGPALQCYSPGNIDKELMEAARNFLRSGGLHIDATSKLASVSKILKWFSVDFGKNETEVLKHAANYLDPPKSEELLELLAKVQLKVMYQAYDWGLNC